MSAVSAIDMAVIGDMVVLKGPTLILVMTDRAFRRALGRGQWWRRPHGFEQRLAAIMAAHTEP